MNIFTKLSDQYQELWKAFIRPARDTYDLSELGPTDFQIDSVKYTRNDLTICNERGLQIKCSHFKPKAKAPLPQPCVVYLHGNSSSRIEAFGCLRELLPRGITVFCFDFCGSGLSDGEYVSLGWWEREDLAAVITHLRGSADVSYIALWGRSMGAVTALLHAYRDPSIAALVIDSPFSNLRLLAEEVVENFVVTKLPRFITSAALSMIRHTILNKISLDIDTLNPIDYVNICFAPALFIAAEEDKFILPHHTKDLYDKYAGPKNMFFVPGDHNSDRPQSAIDSICIFFHNTMQSYDGKSYDSDNAFDLIPEKDKHLMWKNLSLDSRYLASRMETPLKESLVQWEEFSSSDVSSSDNDWIKGFSTQAAVFSQPEDSNVLMSASSLDFLFADKEKKPSPSTQTRLSIGTPHSAALTPFPQISMDAVIKKSNTKPSVNAEATLLSQHPTEKTVILRDTHSSSSGDISTQPSTDHRRSLRFTQKADTPAHTYEPTTLRTTEERLFPLLPNDTPLTTLPLQTDSPPKETDTKKKPGANKLFFSITDTMVPPSRHVSSLFPDLKTPNHKEDVSKPDDASS